MTDYYEGVSNGRYNIWRDEDTDWWTVCVCLPNGTNGRELYQGHDRKRAFEIYEQDSITELKAKAGRAVMGPWHVTTDAGHPSNRRIYAPSGKAVCKVYAEEIGYDQLCVDTADFIATFDPPTVLRMLKAMEAIGEEWTLWRSYEPEKPGLRVYCIECGREREEGHTEVCARGKFFALWKS